MNFKLIIDDEKINHYTDPYDLIHFVNQDMCYSRSYWYPNHDIDQEVSYIDNSKSYSSFYPFTCSCGVAGCSGIFDGVHFKVRKHSVEWRVKKDMGYDFLPARFFSFDKKAYFDMINRLEKELNEKE